MITQSPEKFLNNKQGACRPNGSALAINRQPLGRIVAAAKRGLFLFTAVNARMRLSFTARSDARFAAAGLHRA
jgi:hypothetical protein